MKVIGLTGGIGSGKSTLLNWFQMKGIPCFESDAVGRELLNSSLRDSIILRFGEDIYFDGILDRKKMAKRVFGDKKALADLNKIVHPAVNEAFNNFIEKNQKKKHKQKKRNKQTTKKGSNCFLFLLFVCLFLFFCLWFSHWLFPSSLSLLVLISKKLEKQRPTKKEKNETNR